MKTHIKHIYLHYNKQNALNSSRTSDILIVIDVLYYSCFVLYKRIRNCSRTKNLPYNFFKLHHTIIQNKTNLTDKQTSLGDSNLLIIKIRHGLVNSNIKFPVREKIGNEI